MNPRRRLVAIITVVAVVGVGGAWLVLRDPGPSTAATEPSSGSTDEPSAAGSGGAPAPTGGASSTPTSTPDAPPPSDVPAPPADEPLATGGTEEPGVNDAEAVDAFCTVEPDALRMLVYPPGSTTTDADTLRNAMILVSDLRQQWDFSAFGRPGFQAILEPVDEVEKKWQAALDAFDSGEPATAEQEMAAADAAIVELEATIAAADISCP